MAEWNPSAIRQMVVESVSAELLPGASLSQDDVDLEKAGCLDSMGWVGVLARIEEMTRLRNFGASWPQDLPRSVRALTDFVTEALAASLPEATSRDTQTDATGTAPCERIEGWGSAFGSLLMQAEVVERACGLESGSLRQRAGIESICRAGADEDEILLAQRAADAALPSAEIFPEAVDFLVAVSTTFLKVPSFAPTLHSRLLLRETCAALDVGGACTGFIHALAVAKGILALSGQRTALVVAAEVHSRGLHAPSIPAEFRGLFGDGACAVILKARDEKSAGAEPRLREFVWGCEGSMAAALQIQWADSELHVDFHGEQLASAATSRLLSVITKLESLSGKRLDEVEAVAIHEPNPRLVEILAKRASIPPDKLPFVSRTYGNLGAATCGVGLIKVLDEFRRRTPPLNRPLVFLAAVGPGLLWAGAYLD